jgi:hypothetical protein
VTTAVAPPAGPASGYPPPPLDRVQPPRRIGSQQPEPGPLERAAAYQHVVVGVDALDALQLVEEIARKRQFPARPEPGRHERDARQRQLAPAVSLGRVPSAGRAVQWQRRAHAARIERKVEQQPVRFHGREQRRQRARLPLVRAPPVEREDQPRGRDQREQRRGRSSAAATLEREREQRQQEDAEPRVQVSAARQVARQQEHRDDRHGEGQPAHGIRAGPAGEQEQRDEHQRERHRRRRRVAAHREHGQLREPAQHRVAERRRAGRGRVTRPPDREQQRGGHEQRDPPRLARGHRHRARDRERERGDERVRPRDQERGRDHGPRPVSGLEPPVHRPHEQQQEW